jgi:hypothetical protein
MYQFVFVLAIAESQQRAPPQYLHIVDLGLWLLDSQHCLAMNQESTETSRTG